MIEESNVRGAAVITLHGATGHRLLTLMGAIAYYKGYFNQEGLAASVVASSNFWPTNATFDRCVRRSMLSCIACEAWATPSPDRAAGAVPRLLRLLCDYIAYSTQ